MDEQRLLEIIQTAARENAVSLDLSFNQLRYLPPEIGQLTRLQSLYLNDNELGQIPPELGRLTNLKYLDLFSNDLNQLPPEIGQLKKIQSLNLSCNYLSQLPPEIGQLTSLQYLDLRDNHLIRVPPEIGQLTSLQSLNLSFSRLSQLPSEIGQLTNLKSLNLNFSRLNYLSPEIGRLTSLQFLDLSNNQLNQLPPEMGQLTSLNSLDLRFNQLTQIPSEIGQLINLKLLNLCNNYLNRLPAEIGQLNSLESLNLHNNNLNQLPPEMQKYLDDPKQASREILRYYRQVLEQETDRLFEAKLLIVGEGGAGKTTLAKKIEDEKYQLVSSEESTQGIDIIQWKFPFKENKDFRVNIWDFGGQEIYHATHQFFLTKRSLYILVADSRKVDTDFFYWLNVVELLSERSPILIVKNEVQDRQHEISERQLRGEFINLEKVFSTNLATNRGLPEITQAIQKYITHLPHVGTELPKNWIKVRKALEANPRNHITRDEYLKLCQDNGFTHLEDKLQLSGYLHDLGVCLHFLNDNLLCKTIILKPDWGTNAAYKVLDNHHVILNQGRFNLNDLATIWHEDQYTDMRPELLRLMMNFKLCYEIPSNPKHFIAPQLLSPNQPDYKWDETNNLILRYTYEFMPKGILTRFIVEMHRWLEDYTCNLETKRVITNVWRTGAVLRRDGARAEVIERYHRKEIRIRVAGNHRRDLLANIRYVIDEIHASYEHLKCSTLVPCNCNTCKGNQAPYFYSFNELQERIDQGKETIECRKSPYLDIVIRPLISDITQETKSKAFSPKIRNHVFVSYSHQDTDLFDELKVWLNPLERRGKLKVWDDSKIQAGGLWLQEIQQALVSAKVAVLLVSPHFFASEFINKNELPPLLNSARNDGLTVLWIPISFSPYEDTELERYQAVYSPDKPLRTLKQPMRDKAWKEIYQTIKKEFDA